MVGTESHLDDIGMNSEIFPKVTWYTDKIEISVVSIHSFFSREVYFIIPNTYLLINHVNYCGSSYILVYINIILGSFYCPPNSPASIWEDLTRAILNIPLCFSKR